MANLEKVWYAVVNPHAGSGKTISEWPKAELLFQEKGVEYEYKTTWRKYHASEIAFDACRQGYRRLLAVGGDGTVHEVLDGIVRFVASCNAASGTPGDVPDAVCAGGETAHRSRLSLSDFTLGVIPIGSGNDWIKTLHVPHSTSAVVDLISREHFGKQDVFKLTIDGGAGKPVLSYMANIGGIGFDANVCHFVNFEKDCGKSGKILYLKVLIQNIVKRRNFHCRIYADGALAYEGSVFSVAMGIGRYSGGGMLQVPDALNDDGLLDFTVIPELSMAQIARAVPSLFTGRLLQNPNIFSSRCRDFRVELGEEETAQARIEVDGEVVGTTPLHAELLPDQLNVVAG